MGPRSIVFQEIASLKIPNFDQSIIPNDPFLFSRSKAFLRVAKAAQ